MAAVKGRLSKERAAAERQINRIDGQIKDFVGKIQPVKTSYADLRRVGVNICDAWGYPVVELRFNFVPEGPGWEKIHQEWVERLWNPYRK